MKTGAYWFKFLTDKEQEEFKVNTKFLNYKMKEEKSSFNEFIIHSFVWEETPQGYDYWHEISQRKTD